MQKGPFRPSDTEGVYVEVRPTTGILYGVVNDDTGDPLEDAEVTVNGVTVMTDIDGRYIVPDFSPPGLQGIADRWQALHHRVQGRVRDQDRDDPNQSSSSRRYQIADADGATDGIDFAANDPVDAGHHYSQDAALVATITGTVRDKDGDPVAGVDLTVTNEAGVECSAQPDVAWRCVLRSRRSPGSMVRATAISGSLGCRRTGDDGTFELQITVTDDDADYTITPSKTRYYFDDPYEIERMEAGDTEEGLDFEALRQSRIRGSVRHGKRRPGRHRGHCHGPGQRSTTPRTR